jgi:hypothetical protein
LPGEISDSRIVGDVLYAVSYENGYCWNCAQVERTNVISLDVKVPSKVAKVDELSFPSPDGQYGWGKRSVLVTQNRMFIGGRAEYGGDGSTIHVVDISDPTGKMVKGATVAAAGSIESRWQMDELDGVLRLVSQPGWWSTGTPPIVQTFQIVSSQDIKPLASMNMTLPSPERLRSVRFDGTRAYAITAVQTDPLFVLDFSDPAAPKQLGEVEMPGWVYHMEPRGDRLFALGFDPGNKEGSLNVSLFDVADATAPKLLDRVNFAGNWGQFAEDQDRIHKAFTILDSLGLIFVPYSGWSYSDGGYGCGSWQSGVQIVNFTKDDLVKRGAAPSRGTARRAFLHQERLFAVSDVAIETFDIGNQDQPAAKQNLALANFVNKVVPVGDQVARIGSDWYTSRTVLDVVPLDALHIPAQNAVDLEGALGTPDESKCWYGYWGADNTELFGFGTHVVAVAGYDERRIAVFDTSSGVPVLQGKAKISALAEGDPYYGYYGGYYGSGSIPDTGKPTVMIGSALVVLRRSSKWVEDKQQYEHSAALDVVDLSDPKLPKTYSVALPELLGATGLIVADGKAVFSHWAPSPTSPGKVRFYVDRLDISKPSAPKLTSVNVPGSLFGMDGSGKRAMTVSYSKVVETTSYAKCRQKWGDGAFFDWADGSSESGKCTGYHRTLGLVQVGSTSASVLDTEALADNLRIGRTALGTDRAFIESDAACYGCYGAAQPEILVASGFAAGKITLASVAIPSAGPYYYGTDLIADGTRAVAVRGYGSSVSLIDAKNASAPVASVLDTELDGYGYYSYSWGTSAAIIGDTLVLPRGEHGVKLIDLTP